MYMKILKQLYRMSETKDESKLTIDIYTIVKQGQ